MTTAENPCLSRAWLGYAIDKARGETLWRVCAWCPTTDRTPIEREAERLCITVTHGICTVCAERLRGEVLALEGMASEQATKGVP